MLARVPEQNKRPGVSYAVTDDGIELPVIDLTHASFAHDPSPEELAQLSASSVRSLRRSMNTPPFVLRLLSRHSIIMRGTLEASGAFLTGMATYVQNLGPENLGKGYSGPMDRRLAATIGPTSTRMRLKVVAELTAEGLAPILEARRDGPLHLLNVGGGAAADSTNALILIRRERPDLLKGRRICVHVLDVDGAAPRFGARALAALLSQGAPLHGLGATLDHIHYDWADVGRLRELLERIAAPDATIVGSSEGGLFEYGTDEEIVANLEVVRGATPDDSFMVGTTIRDDRSADPCLRVMKEIGKMPRVRFLGLDELKPLATRAGWVIDRAVEGNPFYHIFRLRKETS